MKNLVALALGILAIMVALFVASGTTNRDSVARPEAALAFATAFHATPSSTPRPSVTPMLSPTPEPTETLGPTPTPLHLKSVQPTSQEILALMFQYPQGGSVVTPGPSVTVERVRIDQGANDILIVTGDGGKAIHQGRVAPVAYGAVLVWSDEEFVISFEHVEFGHRNAAVVYTLSQDQSEIRFVFQDTGIDPGSNRELRRYYTLSCRSGRCSVIDSSAGHSI